MTALVDEIVAALPSIVQPYSKGLTPKEVASHLSCSEFHVRQAFNEIKTAWSAQIVRHGERGGARRIVPLGHDFGLPGFFAKACRKCERIYQSQNEFYCSKKCSASDRWDRPGYRERVGAAISAAQKTPESRARTAETNKRRWAREGEKEKLAAQNKREWADPVKRAKRSAGIQAAHGTPEKRKFYADLRKKNWSDPDYYRKMQAKMIEARNTPEFRAKFSEGLRKRWQDPEQRPKFLAAVRRNGAKAAERNRAKLSAPVNAIAQSVYDAIAQAGAPLTGQEIERATGIACNPIRNALKTLERHGLIVRRSDQPKLTWETVLQCSTKKRA